MDGNSKFNDLRQKYRVFRYRGYSMAKNDGEISIIYDFSADGLCEFHPTISIPVKDEINPFDSDMARDIVFSLGMVELVSYWKAACQPTVIVECGCLGEEEILWWKKLYFNGLGEFFYRNGVSADFESFMSIECTCENAKHAEFKFSNLGLNLVPVGGGKDSDVTLELLGFMHERNRPFTVNVQQARTDAIHAAGYTDEQTVVAYRTIDKQLLTLNAEGFLNGHTPFSAIVAFLGYYCAYLIGAQHIVLSNEESANESNIAGTDINHQYSKSYEFECDFQLYTERRFGLPIKYFSLLRAFSELQIAKQFSHFDKYHMLFRSCNAGSKKNVWCCSCPKCLFVYCVLSPFIEREKLSQMFGCDLLDRADMLADFDGLVGFSSVKPFECVGTKDEVVYALALTVKGLRQCGEKLPYLLSYFADKVDIDALAAQQCLKRFNDKNSIPERFMPSVREMYSYVSTDA